MEEIDLKSFVRPYPIANVIEIINLLVAPLLLPVSVSLGFPLVFKIIYGDPLSF